MKVGVKYCVYSLILFCLCACNEGQNVTAVEEERDTVLFATINLCDSTSFLVHGNEKCKILANMEISYPKMYVENEKTEALQRLFSTSVLGVPADSMSLATAFPQCMDNLMSRYKGIDGAYEEEIGEFDYDVMTDCKLSVKTYPMYNRGGLLGFCKEETAVVNNEKTSVRHYYYAFDLNNLRRMELTDLFSEDSAAKVAEMLKDKLRADMQVESDDELVEMGYYNFENIEAVDNFYVTRDSVIWNFLPRELAVLDEVRISLEREAVEMLLNNK